MFFQNKKVGFTLIELLVVIAIIGTLASTVLASVQDARFAARDSGMISDIKQAQTALELYRNANSGLYPTQPPPDPPGPTCCNPRMSLMTGGTYNLQAFMPTLPVSKNPNHAGGNNDILYGIGSGRTSYTILVKLYKNGGVWCSITHGGAGVLSWNGDPSDGFGGTNYPPCFQ